MLVEGICTAEVIHSFLPVRRRIRLLFYKNRIEPLLFGKRCLTVDKLVAGQSGGGQAVLTAERKN